MTRVPPIMIFLLNFVTGIPSLFVILISEIFVFGMGPFTLAPHTEPLLPPDQPLPPPIESQVIGILIVASYFCLIILGNKWLISDSPYKFEYRIVAFLGFAIGFFVGFGSVT